jgi:hypothetical protein
VALVLCVGLAGTGVAADPPTPTEARLKAELDAATKQIEALKKRTAELEAALEKATVAREAADREAQAARLKLRQMTLKLEGIVDELKDGAGAVPPGIPLGKVPLVPDGIRGTVTAARDGKVVLSLGKDAGLAPGQSLDVYRTTPTARYLGTVVIEQAYPKEAVGVFKPANPKKALKDLKPDELPQAGDAVGRIGPGH